MSGVHKVGAYSLNLFRARLIPANFVGQRYLRRWLMSEFCILLERVEFDRVGRRDLQVLTNTEKQNVHTYIYLCQDLVLVKSRPRRVEAGGACHCLDIGY